MNTRLRRSVLSPIRKLKRRCAVWHTVLGSLITVIIVLVAANAHAQELTFGKTDFYTYEKAGSFSLEIPDYLVEVHDMSADASVQFKNIYNQTYLMVVIEQRSIEGNIDLQQLEENFESNLLNKGGQLLRKELTQIDRLQACQNEVVWAPDGTDSFAYLITFVEARDCLVKIYSWTPASQKQYLDDFKITAASFAILKDYQSKG